VGTDGTFDNHQPSIINQQLAPGRAKELQIRYTANSFADPLRVRFRYRLKGQDDHWHAETDERVAYFTNLRPGAHQFEVMAANAYGVWNEAATTFPFSLAPHFWQTWPFYAGCVFGAIGFAAGIQSYRLHWQRRLLQSESQRALAGERARIARDLHDDLGASLTGVALQLEAAQRQGLAEGPQLAALAGETRSLAHELRELAWATNPRCDNAGSLVAFIGELTERFCRAAGLDYRLSLPEAERSLCVPARVRHELVVVVKESLANVASHAGARQVTLTLTAMEGDAQVVIRDDGRGFDAAVVTAGSGLRNLRERLQQLGGAFTVESRPGQGTTVTARLPLNNSHPS
jgi:signal transduction histidine kinase